MGKARGAWAAYLQPEVADAAECLAQTADLPAQRLDLAVGVLLLPPLRMSGRSHRSSRIVPMSVAAMTLGRTGAGGDVMAIERGSRLPKVLYRTRGLNSELLSKNLVSLSFVNYASSRLL